MKKALVLLANGCEDMEAVTTVDILRRGGVEVTVAGVTDGVITASRGVRLMPDIPLNEALKQGPWDMVVMPGGMDGTRSLTEDRRSVRPRWPWNGRGCSKTDGLRPIRGC